MQASSWYAPCVGVVRVRVRVDRVDRVNRASRAEEDLVKLPKIPFLGRAKWVHAQKQSSVQ